MKNYFKKSNKKGFTLVELLAVIVILALLIIITANTILPMLGRTKQTGMVTYAKRVLNNAVTNLEADKITEGDMPNESTKIYQISQQLTEDKSYFGCVKISKDKDGNISYGIKLFTTKDDLYMNAEGITDITDLGTPTFTEFKNDPTIASYENTCATNYLVMNEKGPTGSAS